MKIHTFQQMDEIGDRLGLNPKQLAGAKKRFAAYRDNVEKLHDTKTVMTACLIASIRETTLKQKRSRESTFKELYPFLCKKCMVRFNGRRGLAFHKCGH
jgi:hypothetical protein